MDSGKIDGVAPAVRVITSSIRFDPSYFKSKPGILKCLQVVFSLIGYICVAVSLLSANSRSRWFSFVSMLGFWVTGILLVLYILHVIERLHMVPWNKLEFGYCALLSFFYFTAATACASETRNNNGLAAAAFFGYSSMLLYGADAFLKFKAWRNGETAQGEPRDQNASIGDMQP